jgi:hypothetical protein
MYEAKNQDLAVDNEELINKLDENKQKVDMIEEENLYLKAIVNSSNFSKNSLST